MRRTQATLAMLAVALFAVALAAVGLAIGVVQVPRLVELGSFFIASATALAAMSRTLARLLEGDVLEEDEDRPPRILPETPSGQQRRLDERRRRLGRERKAARRTLRLLVCSLLMGMLTAVLRSGAEAVADDSAPPWRVVVEHASRSGDLRSIAGLAVAGIVLALVAALLLRAGRGRAVAAGAAVAGAGALGAAAVLAFGLGHVSVDPRFEITPTLKIERPTLLSLQEGSDVTVAPRLVVRPHVAVHVSAERRSLCRKRILPITP